MFMESANISPRIGGQRIDTALPGQSANYVSNTNITNHADNANNTNGSNDIDSGFDDTLTSLNDKKTKGLNDSHDGTGPDGTGFRHEEKDNAAGGESSQQTISGFIPSPFGTGKMADIIDQIEKINQIENVNSHDGEGQGIKIKGLAESLKNDIIIVSKNQLTDEATEGKATEDESSLRKTSKQLNKNRASEGQIRNSNIENNLRSSIESISGRKTLDGILQKLNAGIEITSGDGKARANGNSTGNVVKALQKLPSLSKFMKITAAANEVRLPVNDYMMIESKIIEKLKPIAKSPDNEIASGKPVTEGKEILVPDRYALNPKGRGNDSRGNDNIIKLAESDKDSGDEKSNPDFPNEKNENSLNNKSDRQGKFINAINSKIKAEFTVSGKSGGPESAVSERIINIRPSEFAAKAMQLVKNAQPGGKVSARMVLRPASLGTVFVNVSLNGNLASLDIKVDRPEILKQLESQLSVLRDKLSQNGIKTEQMEIRLKGQGSTDSNLAEQFEHYQGQKKQRQDRQEFLRSYQYLAKNLAKMQGNTARLVNYGRQGSLVEPIG